jgi:hypothetical protein
MLATVIAAALVFGAVQCGAAQLVFSCLPSFRSG